MDKLNIYVIRLEDLALLFLKVKQERNLALFPGRYIVCDL